jgi:cardiolipin synthase
MVIGIIAIVGVFGALFLPDWPSDDFTLGFDADPGSIEFVEWTSTFLNTTIFRGGSITILQNGDGFYPAMLEAIRNAKETVNFEVYIFEPDEIGRQFMDAFKERARNGIEVRFLLDGFGGWKMTKRYREELQEAGVMISRFRAPSLRSLVRFYKRTHRRAIVIDGKIGFTGGAAVSKKWKGNVRTPHEWRDSMCQVTGPMVSGIQTAFATDWVYCTGEVIAGPRFFPRLESGPGPCGLSVVSSPSDALQPIRLLLWLSYISARKRVWICNSYFIPDSRLRDALIERAKSGIDARILVPGNHTDAVPVQWAGRSYYRELLEAGVRIFEYEPSMMHAKTTVVDSTWSVVGSANLDERSMELNEENVLGVSDVDFAQAIEQGIEADFTRSKEIKLEEWRRRPVIQRCLEAFAKILIEQY